MIELETYDTHGNQYIITDWLEPNWSTVYGEEGSGFAFYRFTVPRPVGFNYLDIGYGYEFICRKYLNTILFHGTIREIEEESSRDGDRISITAFGEVVASDDDEVLRAYCDTRLALWSPPSELPKGLFRPDLFSTGANALGLFLHPNNGADIEAGQYTELEYEFYPGETAERFKCTLSSIMGAGAIFDAEVSQISFEGKINTVDDGTDTITYKDDSGEDTIQAGDTITNSTRGETATVQSVNTGTDTIVFSGAPDLSTWQADDSIALDQGRVLYTGDAGESFVVADMILYNIDQGKEADVTAIDTGLNLITVSSKSLISGWAVGDDLYVPGPLFRAQVTSVSGADVVYDDVGMYGEGSIVTSWPLANLTKKSIATVQSNVAGTNTITVTNSDHLSGWEEGDVIIQATSLFYATVASVINDGDGTGKVVWNAGTPIGLRLVSAIDPESGSRTSGWTLYNQTRDEYATVENWDLSNRHIYVDAWTDIQSWSASDVIRIYTPLKMAVYDSADNRIWPASDERQGAVPHDHLSINVTKTGDATPPKLTVRITGFVDGSFNESTFFQLTDVKTYSTQSAVTTEFLAQQMVVVLSVSGHGWDSSTDDIESITKVLEPAFFEYQPPREVLTWACNFGDGSGNRLAWGIRMNDQGQFFLETQDLDSISYIVRRQAPVEASVGGTVQESLQQVRGRYRDPLGEQQVTDWQSDSGSYFNSRYRRGSVDLEGVDNEDDADDLVAAKLAESKYPKKRSRYRVEDGAVFTTGGVPVPFDEVKATGRLMRIEDWRSVEAGRSATDLRNNWTTEQLVGVQVDYDARSVELIPGGAKSTFERMLAELARINLR